jgi:hypothetical protein
MEPTLRVINIEKRRTGESGMGKSGVAKSNKGLIREM